MPEYTVVEIQGTPEQDSFGNTGAFIKVAGDLPPGCDGGCLLRMKGMFPIVGDVITDRVLEQATSKAGNTYWKLVKPAKGSGSQGRSQAAQGDGPDEAYWAGQNAAKGRSAAQQRALAYFAIGGQVSPNPDDLIPMIDWFYEDVQRAQQAAVERARPPQAEQPSTRSASPPPTTLPGGAHDLGNGGPPSELSLATVNQQKVLVAIAKERGLDQTAMKVALRLAFGVESFSLVPIEGCVDKWKQTLDRMVSDVPIDWPDEPALAPEDEESVPF